MEKKELNQGKDYNRLDSIRLDIINLLYESNLDYYEMLGVLSIVNTEISQNALSSEEEVLGFDAVEEATETGSSEEDE